MTGDKVTRQRIRSDSSVDSVDHQTPESGNMERRAKSRRQGNYTERRQLKATSLGKAAWDKLFTGENFDIPPTRFIEKVKAAVSEKDYQDIKKGILDALQNEKDYLYDYSYSTPTEATNRIYSMLTEIIIIEADQVINYDFKAMFQERSEIKRKVSQVDYNTNKANGIKFSCDALLMESRVATEDLIKAA